MDSKGFELQARFHAPNDQTFINIKNTYHRKVIDAYNALLIDLMKLFFKRDLEEPRRVDSDAVSLGAGVATNLGAVDLCCS